jgi:hypothetical protein
MRLSVVIALRVGFVLVIALTVLLVYPTFTKAKARSGPGPRAMIRRNLEVIGEAKAILRQSRQLSDDHWPNRNEIASGYTGKTNISYEELLRPSRWGEVYIVNRIDAPAYAYFSNAVADFPEGFLLTSQDFEPGAQPSSPANGSEPIRSGTNSTSSAAGSRR